MNTKQAARDTYLARTASIHAKLERLQQLADDHFGHDPDATAGPFLQPNLRVADLPLFGPEIAGNPHQNWMEWG